MPHVRTVTNFEHCDDIDTDFAYMYLSQIIYLSRLSLCGIYRIRHLSGLEQHSLAAGGMGNKFTTNKPFSELESDQAIFSSNPPPLSHMAQGLHSSLPVKLRFNKSQAISSNQ